MTFKKILSLILACCMLLAVLSLTSCGNKGNDNNDNDGNTNVGGETNENVKAYSVTVLDGDNNPVEGVKLVITNEETYPTATTNASGKASIEFPEGTIVKVMVTTVPNGYIKPEKVSGVYHGVFASGSTELTITLEKEAIIDTKVEYTVKVLDKSGNPVVGMKVQVCPGGTCLPDDFYTDENGEIKAMITPGKEVKIQLLPLSGYDLPSTVDGTYHAVIPVGETAITIDSVTKK